MGRRSSNALRRFASRANREQLWAALESGLIDLVATDHSPCPPEMKRREEGRWNLAWGGIASLGLALPVMNTALAQRGFAWMRRWNGLARGWPRSLHGWRDWLDERER